LRIVVIDLVTSRPTRALYSRYMNANLASIMAQAVAFWCEQLGHEVRFICYTGAEDILREAGDDADLAIIGAFTRSAQLAYALSSAFRAKGIVTALGGPHARCYPDDALRWFDYVLGFTDRETMADMLADCAPGRPTGQYLAAARQPRELPSARERWKFIAKTLEGAPKSLKIVPMISSLGCPYTCSFCIDSTIPYQPLSRDTLADDLRFVAKAMPDALIGWHDPNFGVRFDEYLSTIEAATEGSALRFIAESSLSLLSEKNVRRMAAAGFQALLPGIESWYGMGFKSKTGAKEGMAKVEQVADHVNMLLEHIPYVQTNFVLGLDTDEGTEPFELTKEFVTRVPGAFPAYSQRTAFGEATPENLELQKGGARARLPVPLPRQQSGDERRSAQLRVGRLLREADGSHRIQLLGEGALAALAREPAPRRQMAQLHPRRLERRERANPPLSPGPGRARRRSRDAGLFRAAERRAAALLSRQAALRPRADMGAASR
jgi:hypothetical protein